MTTINENYVSFETAKLLKEKGFPQQRMEFAVATRDCSFIVNGNQKVKECAGTKFPYYPYSKLFLYEEDWAVLPTLQMAMKWLREVHNIHTNIMYNDRYAYPYEFHIIKQHYASKSDTHRYTTYEECAEKAIKYCLKNLI